MARLVICGSLTPTNIALRTVIRSVGVEAHLYPPRETGHAARPDDSILGRIDIRPTLDGIEPGLEQLRKFEAAGLTVLNRAGALYTCHDKLATAIALNRAGIPHPETAVLESAEDCWRLAAPVVVKPRFGSWGRETFLCPTERSARQTLRALRRRRWFRLQGALVQRLVPPVGEDLRIIVAGGAVVGAVSRVAAPGEWRTNISLGGTRRPVVPPAEACELALAAAAAVGIDLVGVDLLPVEGGYTVLELNGCADFTSDYSFAGDDVFERSVLALLDRAEAGAEPGSIDTFVPSIPNRLEPRIPEPAPLR